MGESTLVMTGAFEALAEEGRDTEEANHKMAGVVVYAFTQHMAETIKNASRWVTIGDRVLSWATHLFVFAAVLAWGAKGSLEAWRALVADPGRALEHLLADFSAFALGLIGVWDGEMLAWAAASLIFLSVSTRNWWLDAALEKKALTRAFGHRAEAVDDLFTRNSLLSEIQMHNRVSLAASLLGTATVALVLRLLSTAPNIPSWVSALVAVAGLWGASHLAKNLGHHWLEKDLGVLLQYVKVELGMNGWRYVGLWERSSH